MPNTADTEACQRAGDEISDNHSSLWDCVAQRYDEWGLVTRTVKDTNNRRKQNTISNRTYADLKPHTRRVTRVFSKKLFGFLWNVPQAVSLPTTRYMRSVTSRISNVWQTTSSRAHATQGLYDLVTATPAAAAAACAALAAASAVATAALSAGTLSTFRCWSGVSFTDPEEALACSAGGGRMRQGRRVRG